MAWYALFVMTGHEHEVAGTITQRWRISGGLKPIVLTRDFRFRKAGKVLSERKCWIPGYVFLESEMDGLDFYQKIKPYVAQTKKVIKLLQHGRPIDLCRHTNHADWIFEVQEAERLFLQKLLNHEHCVEMSYGYKNGRSITVTDGPLVGLEGLIKNFDRHKMVAVIETLLFGSMQEVKVGLEVADAIP